jgi:hypothetical protein
VDEWYGINLQLGSISEAVVYKWYGIKEFERKSKISLNKIDKQSR